MRHFSLSFGLLAACSFVGVVIASHDWWENGHFYQIYPRSFQDSDGDGLGDLNGITSRLEHLKSINVAGVWLSPIFESPMRDMGYDISDFRKIHHEFGTMADFERLLARCKELDIKLILDFVPNHTSDQHEWFKISSDPEHPQYRKYKDFYIWHEGKLLPNGTRLPPSNWISVFKGSMWTWVSSRKAFYFHQFMKEQPDLNFRNAAVNTEMKKVLRFWLKKGVNGFRIDAVPHLFENPPNVDGSYDDEPVSGLCNDPEDYCYHTHTQTTHLNETYELVYQWRSVVDEEEFLEQTRILMTEAYASVPNMARYYGRVRNGVVVKYGAQIPFNFQLMSVTRTSNASEFKDDIEAWMNVMPKGRDIQANWVLGNHDGSRIASRYGTERIDLFNILIKTLPGITVTYYGEEIGMTDVNVSEVPRERARTPLQWNSSVNAGFSTATKTWLPVADNYTKNNIELQNSETWSHLKVIQKLMQLRQHPTFKYGSLLVKTITSDGKDLLLYKREIKSLPSAEVFIVVLNLASTPATVNLQDVFDNLPDQMKEVISHDANEPWIITNSYDVKPNQGTVLVGSWAS